jgi:hypothetical protein
MSDKEPRGLKIALNDCSLQELRDLMHQVGHLDFNWSSYQTVNLQFHEGIAVWKSGDKWCALHPKADTSSWYYPEEGRVNADCHQCTGDRQGIAIVRAYLWYKLRG